MAQAYKCDRCGALYEPYEPYVDDKLMYNGHCIFMELSPRGNIVLCKSCQKQLISFLHGRPLQCPNEDYAEYD